MIYNSGLSTRCETSRYVTNLTNEKSRLIQIMARYGVIRPQWVKQDENYVESLELPGYL